MKFVRATYRQIPIKLQDGLCVFLMPGVENCCSGTFTSYSQTWFLWLYFFLFSDVTIIHVTVNVSSNSQALSDLDGVLDGLDLDQFFFNSKLYYFALYIVCIYLCKL